MSRAVGLSQKSKVASSSDRSFVSASSYSFEQLADIYNQTRIDYIVPMPMNSKRLADYVRFYDVDLDISTVVLNKSQSPIGLIMIGIRGDDAWITRLGVLPEQRGNGIGQDLMEISIDKLREQSIHQIQLEVITGNEPAYRMFLKLGFEVNRELLVIRRPPKLIGTNLLPKDAVVAALDSEAIARCLKNREAQIAWTEATASLLNTQALNGIHLTLPSGEIGWLIYQLAAFEVTHVVLSPGASQEMIRGLIYQLHKQHPMHDTKIENIPREHEAWQEFQKLGYLEVFSRIEMFKALDSSR